MLKCLLVRYLRFTVQSCLVSQLYLRLHMAALFADKLHRLFDQRMHIAVIVDERNDLAITFEDTLYHLGRTKRTTELECLSRIEKLDSKNTLGVLHYAYKLGGSIRTHADMILLTL